jgi:hypothetical protein
VAKAEPVVSRVSAKARLARLANAQRLLNLAFMTASSRLHPAPARRQRHDGKYGKDFSRDVIFLTLECGRNDLRSPRTQHISNHVSRDRADR